VLAVPLEILVRVQALSLLAVTGKPMRRCTIGPASSGLGKGLAGRDVLVPSHSSETSVVGWWMHADTIARCGETSVVGRWMHADTGARCSETSVVGRWMHADTVARCVSSDTLVRLASGLSGQCGMAGSCFGGRTALDLRIF
jgi:hypothetical protein